MTDLEAVTQWVEGYMRAWSSNTSDDIAALFAEDAAYYPAPYADPWRGRDAIVAAWLDRKDVPDQTAFSWFPVTVSPDLSVVQGITTYPHATYSNLWLIRLDNVRQCREFTEWWMEHDGRGSS